MPVGIGDADLAVALACVVETALVDVIALDSVAVRIGERVVGAPSRKAGSYGAALRILDSLVLLIEEVAEAFALLPYSLAAARERADNVGPTVAVQRIDRADR